MSAITPDDLTPVVRGLQDRQMVEELLWRVLAEAYEAVERPGDEI